MVHFGNDWDDLLKNEFDKEYYIKLHNFLLNEYRTKTIYPNMYDIFRAMQITSYSDVKCVIIGQDPYHEPGQANGLSFSVKKGVIVPPSLVNIFKEIKNDTGIDNTGKHGDLTKWAEEGVLLLNNVLTVVRGMANSHAGKGWEIFTANIIKLLNNHKTPVVFMLWGSNARRQQEFITNPKHLILTAPHPSPLSAYRGFFGCCHFSKANDFIVKNGMRPIDWSID